MNSCNPVFMDVGARVGVDGMYQTFKKLGLFEKQELILPGKHPRSCIRRKMSGR